MRLPIKLVGAAVALAGTVALGCAWVSRDHPDELKLPGTVETQEVYLGSKVTCG
jgi:hypothetical protein